MKFFNKRTYVPPVWVRGTLRGSSHQFAPEAGSRPMFSDPLDETVYDEESELRQPEQQSIREAIPTDKSPGGLDK